MFIYQLLSLALLLCFWPHRPSISALSYSWLSRAWIFKHSAHVSGQESPYPTPRLLQPQGSDPGGKSPSQHKVGSQEPCCYLPQRQKLRNSEETISSVLQWPQAQGGKRSLFPVACMVAVAKGGSGEEAGGGETESEHSSPSPVPPTAQP